MTIHTHHVEVFQRSFTYNSIWLPIKNKKLWNLLKIRSGFLSWDSFLANFPLKLTSSVFSRARYRSTYFRRGYVERSVTMTNLQRQ